MTKENIIKDNALLVLYLKALSKEEWRRFGDFVRSPIYNKQEKVVLLYELLSKKFSPGKNIFKTDLLPALGLKKCYRKNYSISKEEDANLRKLFSVFTNLIKEYLIFVKSKKYPTYNQRLLVSSLMERRAYGLVPGIIKKQKVLHSKEKGRDSRYYLNYFLLREAEYYLNIIQKNRKDLVTTEELISDFRTYYISTLLRFISSAKNKEMILNVNYDYPENDWLMNFIKNNLKASPPLVQGYYFVLNLIQEKNKKWFLALKGLLSEQDIALTVDVQREFFGHLLNYSSRQIRKGNQDYRKEKHQIYQDSLQRKIWDSGMYFSAHHYFLVVHNALKIGKLDWVQCFMGHYKNELCPKQGEQVSRLASAYFSYYDNDHENAQLQLSKVSEAEDFFYALYLRVLWIQLHYENETEPCRHPLPFSLEALRGFLGRNKQMNPTIKGAYLNFMKLTERLFRIKQKPEFDKNRMALLTRLKKDVEETELVEERDWLLLKIGTLLDDFKHE